MSFTIGSLFDGSGGFPLAAALSGGTPKWASEIEPYPIAVTKSRFPNMKHLGSITDIRGDEIEPVDVISFGSPCQDLSVAGLRKGLKHDNNGDDETTRSGLFIEAVRIIKEMRKATNGVYPRFALWENVPGAFSSNKGEDFRVVLEELIKVVNPATIMPEVPKNGWAYSDCYRGDGWSIAYRVLDAQYWGVPQRRRRIYLVADFRGECAGEVLFERDGLRGYFTESGASGQTVAGDAEGGIRAADCEGFDGYNSTLTGDKSSTLGVNCGMSTGRNGVVVPYTMKIRSGCEGGGKGALLQTDKSATLSTLNDQYLFQPMALDVYNQSVTGSVTKALTAIKSDADHVLVAVYPAAEPIAVAKGPGAVAVRYIVRRLTPTECARLQGFPDFWGHPDKKTDLTDEEFKFWLGVRNTHAAINNKATKNYTKEQILKWHNGLHTDSSEYKMWGNGIALPNALYVMQGIADAIDSVKEPVKTKREQAKDILNWLDEVIGT